MVAVSSAAVYLHLLLPWTLFVRKFLGFVHFIDVTCVICFLVAVNSAEVSSFIASIAVTC